MSELFDAMDDASRSFYRTVFGNAMMNIHAVRMGYFDTYLCETDDPRVVGRWKETAPKLAQAMRERAAKDREEDNGPPAEC